MQNTTLKIHRCDFCSVRELPKLRKQIKPGQIYDLISQNNFPLPGGAAPLATVSVNSSACQDVREWHRSRSCGVASMNFGRHTDTRNICNANLKSQDVLEWQRSRSCGVAALS